MFGPKPPCAGGLASFGGVEGGGQTVGQTKFVTEAPGRAEFLLRELMFLDSDNLGITEVVVVLISCGKAVPRSDINAGQCEGGAGSLPWKTQCAIKLGWAGGVRRSKVPEDKITTIPTTCNEMQDTV
jgi:hypothetical protein